MFLEVFKEYLQANIIKAMAVVALITAILGAGSCYLYMQYFQVPAESKSESTDRNTSSTDSKTSNSAKISVDISGAVNRPGVIAIETGKRVLDLINSAGGLDPLVSVPWVTRVLNLAQILKDSQKIYIPFEYDIAVNTAELALLEIPTFNETTKQSSESSSNQDSGGDLVNVNTASKADLIDLPSIGDVTADKIITNRPYADATEFKSKSGVTNSVFEKIKSLITY